MLKVRVVIDTEKIEKEGKYDPKEFWATILNAYEKFDLRYAGDGYFVEAGMPQDFAHFWGVNLALSDSPWFLDNVKEWLWFNSDDSDDPEDFSIEDLAEFYKTRRKRA